MDRKYIASLQESLPRLSFGIMRLDRTPDGKIDFDKASKLVDDAMQQGINYFDTAMPYLGGESELFLGKVLPKYERSSYLLADKLPIYYIKQEGDAERYFAQQLENCNTEYFDFYLVHSLSDAKRIDPFEKFDLYNFMAQKKAEGKIRHMGFSFHGKPETLRYLLDTYDWEFVQLQINYYDWVDMNAKELYDIVEAHGLPCFVMEPVKGGFLSTFSPRVEAKMRAHNPQASLSSWAMRWVGSQPNIANVLSGMTSGEQLEDNIRTFTDFQPMTAEEEAILQEVTADLQSIHAVPCTRCEYCLPCPKGVKIPTVFSIYNNYKKTENLAFLKMQYNNERLILASERAHACVGCKLCMKECPQQIQIPTWLRQIDKEFRELDIISEPKEG